MFDNTPNRLESAHIQRNTTNGWYEQVNISGSNLIIYHDENGFLTADLVSVWAAKYGIGAGGGVTPGGSYNISASYASGSTSASYTLTASFSLNGGGTGGTSLSSSWASASIYSLTASFVATASYYPTFPTTVLSASWVSASTTINTASYALTANMALTSSYVQLGGTDILQTQVFG